MKTSSAQAARDTSRAEARLRNDTRDGLTFSTARAALAFMFERGQAMSSPQGCLPTGEKAPDGSTVVVRVDGGRGGSIDDVHATLQTLRQAMEELHRDDRIAHDIVTVSVRDGLSQAEAGKRLGMAASSVQVHLGRGIGFLTGWLRRAEIVRPGN